MVYEQSTRTGSLSFDQTAFFFFFFLAISVADESFLGLIRSMALPLFVINCRLEIGDGFILECVMPKAARRAECLLTAIYVCWPTVNEVPARSRNSSCPCQFANGQ